MLIAKEKRKNNVAEYILYMWQLEDLMRSFEFSMDLIEQNLISQFQQSEKIKQDIRDWYANLIVMMHEEKIQNKGHLSIVNSLVEELNNLHLRIVGKNNDTKYMEQFHWASQNIKEFRKKIPGEDISDIQICLTALYGYLLMKLQNHQISTETKEAMTTFSNLLAILAYRFKQMEAGNLEI